MYTIDGGTVPAQPKSGSGLALNAAVYDVDLFDTTASVITGYKIQGKKVICYFSAGSYEINRPDIANFTSACYCGGGATCKMDGWDEWWLDIHSATCKTNIKSVMASRIALAKSKGCDGVDPDNVDSYVNTNGFGNTEADQLQYNLFLATTAHANGLAVGLKNAGDLLTAHKTEIVAAFDFAVVEQCEEYQECDVYLPFIDAKKPAFDIEYNVPAPCKPGWFSLKYSTLDLSYVNVANSCPEYPTK